MLAAALVLWVGPAQAQTVTLTHTGSATVTDGKIQLVEGGNATTFQVSLSSDFVADIKATHPEIERAGATVGSYLSITRSSTDVTWTTSGNGSSDRTDEFEISYGGTALNTRHNDTYNDGGTTIPEQLYFYLPLDTANNNNGETGAPPVFLDTD